VNIDMVKGEGKEEETGFTLMWYFGIEKLQAVGRAWQPFPLEVKWLGDLHQLRR